MTIRKLLIGLVLLALFAGGGWYGWRWYTAPQPPDIPLQGAGPEVTEAVEKAVREVRRRPRSGEAWGKLGMLLTAQGFFQPAVDCFHRAQQFDPLEPRWPFLNGTVLLTVDPPAALPRLREALPLTRSPEIRAGMLFTLAVPLIEYEMLEEAEQHLQALRELEGDSPRYHYGQGLLAQARGDRKAAREHLSRLTEYPYARKKASAFLAALTEGETALHYRQQATRLQDDLMWPLPYEEEVQGLKVFRTGWKQHFYELEQQGKRREAANYLQQVAEETPDEDVCFTLGMALLTLNEFDRAEEPVRKALAANPRNIRTYTLLGNVLLGRGGKLDQEGGKEKARTVFAQALDAAEKAIALQSDNAFAHLLRGQALKELGRTKEAIAALNDALLRGPEFAEIHAVLGETLAESGRLEEGLKHLENAVRHAKPNDERPRKALRKWQRK